jgi:mxaK protein
MIASEQSGGSARRGPRAYSFASTIARRIAAARGALIWTLLLASVAALLWSGMELAHAMRANATLRALGSGRDVAVDAAKALPAVLEGRAEFLLFRDRIEDAQPVLDQAAGRAPRAVLKRMLYNMANARMRAAIKAIDAGNYDKAIPLVSLAKSEYRKVLGLDPDFWNAKYNLDVAMRLVRDLPMGEGEDKDPAKLPSKLWTDLPGVPTGLP